MSGEIDYKTYTHVGPSGSGDEQGEWKDPDHRAAEQAPVSQAIASVRQDVLHLSSASYRRQTSSSLWAVPLSFSSRFKEIESREMPWRNAFSNRHVSPNPTVGGLEERLVLAQPRFRFREACTRFGTRTMPPPQSHLLETGPSRSSTGREKERGPRSALGTLTSRYAETTRKETIFRRRDNRGSLATIAGAHFTTHMHSNLRDDDPLPNLERKARK